MICFKDRTFCSSPNCTNKCGRQWTPELAAEAEKWWGGKDYPVAMSYFCGGEDDE